MDNWICKLMTNVCACGGSLCGAVWKELEKENKEFFEAYLRNRAERASETEMRQRIRNMVLDSSK